MRAARPYAVVEEPLLMEAGAQGVDGRFVRIAVRLYDSGERPVRLRALCGAVEDVIEAMPDALPEGWKIVGRTLARSRIAAEAGNHWLGMVEFAVRMLRVH